MGVKVYIVFIWILPLCSLVLFNPEEGSNLVGEGGRPIY